MRVRNEPGWTLAGADPRQAVRSPRRAQRAGESGQRLAEETTAERKPTVDALPADDAFLYGNEEAARRIGDQIAVLRDTEPSRSDPVRVPARYVGRVRPRGVPEGAVACSRGIANGLYLTARD
ncbi:hypothetical protein [Streptomyces coeruleorubidus]|uniref:hypothetical protein n=1 Tax=Streptomyces coeruleorubidus TaxID=116188 RepID=UPI0033F8644F